MHPRNATDLTWPEWVEAIDEAVAGRGGPKSDDAKVSRTIRLDGDVIEKCEATGPGRQRRINHVLKRVQV